MSTQIAVRLTEDELAALDWIVVRCDYPSRADGVRAAITALAERLHAEAVSHAIIDGYRRHPETPAELAEAERSTRDAIAEEPWERWW
jgi:Arc/MetJ-type ribon-helix-helix transcriptional regulator